MNSTDERGGLHAAPGATGYGSSGRWLWLAIAVVTGLFGVWECLLPGGSVAAGFGPITWSLVIAISGYAAFVFGDWLVRRRSWVLRLIVAGCLVQVIPALVVTYLGLLEILSRGTMLLVMGGVGGCCVWLLSRRVAWNGVGRDGDGRASGVLSQGFREVGRPDFLFGVGLGLVLLAGGLITLKQLLYVSSDADSTFYHLPMIAEWCRTGSIWSVERIKPIAQAYPGFKEALLTAMTLPIGNEHLALPGGLEYALFAFVAFGLMRRFRVPRGPAVAGVAYLATMPVMAAAGVKQANTDIPLATAIGASVLFLAMYVRRPSGRIAALAGLSLGVLAALKFSGLVYVGALLCVAALHWVLARHRGRRPSWQRCVLHVGAGAAVALAIAGPWYARNLILFGNPLYPAEVSIAGQVLFNGPLGTSYFAPLTLGWDVGPLVTNAGHFEAAFGWLVPVVLLGIVAFVVRGLVRPGELRRGLPLLVLPVLLAVAFLHHPYNKPSFHYYYNMRYLLGVVLVGFCTALACVPRTRGPRTVFSWILILFAVVNLALWTHHVYWITAAAALLGLWGVVRRRERAEERSNGVLWWSHVGAVVCLAVCAFVLQPMRTSLQYDPDYGYRALVTQPAWGQISAYVHEHVRESRVVVCGDRMLFPLYGEDLSNSVYAMDGPLAESAVLSFCDACDADYLVIYRPVVARPAESRVILGDSLGERLLANHGSRFSVELEVDGAYVLRVHASLDSALAHSE